MNIEIETVETDSPSPSEKNPKKSVLPGESDCSMQWGFPH